MNGNRLAPALLAVLCLMGCSGKWHASVEPGMAGRSDTQGLRVALSSSLGDRFEASLVGRCIEVEIDQNPKLKNQIAIKVIDGNGNVIGEASTHDLANRPLTIVLDGGGQVLVTPDRSCKRS